MNFVIKTYVDLYLTLRSKIELPQVKLCVFL